MEEVRNLTMDDVLEIMQDFPVKPRGYKVVVTLNVEDESEDEFSLTTGHLSESQYIVAVGDKAYDLKAGMKVLIDLERMMVTERVDGEQVSRIKIRPLYVNDRVYGLINDNVIDALDEREESDI